MQRRYVFGPGVDEPLVWYEGAGTGDRRYLIADERGSIVAVSNAAGAVTTVNAYDEYGQSPTLTGRFGYTGQAWLAEAGVYHYKARAYVPALGRFAQTDPIGLAGGMNLYAYVGNDPVNATDPSGLQSQPPPCPPGRDDEDCITVYGTSGDPCHFPTCLNDQQVDARFGIESGYTGGTGAGRRAGVGVVAGTIRVWLAEALLHKARAYVPAIGRFAQTDPIGFAGG